MTNCYGGMSHRYLQEYELILDWQSIANSLVYPHFPVAAVWSAENDFLQMQEPQGYWHCLGDLSLLHMMKWPRLECEKKDQTIFCKEKTKQWAISDNIGTIAFK